jgi:ABC-type amino acid transport substrate-binding protein
MQPNVVAATAVVADDSTVVDAVGLQRRVIHSRKSGPEARWASMAAKAERWPAIATVVAAVLAISVRGFLVMSRSFPLNDGALFLLMTEEIGDHGFRLPVMTAYNAAHIPFAYSPLGFYLAAFLHFGGGIDLFALFRILPLVFSCLCVLAFYLLARDLAPTRATLIASLATFAVLPRSFLWLIMGGGLTRSMGFFFAILTLWQLHRVYSRQAWRHVPWATLFASLTVLSHLGTAPFVAFSAVLMLLSFGRTWRSVQASLVIVAGTVLLTAPWWASVAATHGFAPFIAAGATGGTVFGTHRGEALTKLAFFGLGTAEPLFPLIGALAILGSFAMLTRRGAFVPLWWLTIILLDTRAGATYASIPVALLAGLAITEVIVPIIARPPLWSGLTSSIPSGGWDIVMRAPRRRQWAVAAVLFVLMGYGVASSVVRRPSLGAEGRYLTSLTTEDRRAMSWVVSHTPPTSRFVIMVGGAAGGWWADRVGEWFPVLARRVSVATVQGTEWLPAGTFERREREYDRLQGCAAWGARCLSQWARTTGRAYTHVYIPKTLAFPCCEPLDSALRHDPTYRLLFDGPGAAIYELREPAFW